MRLLMSLFCLGWIVSTVSGQEARPPIVEDKPHIDIVFCIDCSGSMNEVIETAKLKVWAIVNEVAKAKPAPVLRIGLIGYGNGANVLRQTALTDDLDAVFADLNKYRDDAGQGDEFVGTMIHKATQDMKWAEGKQTLKIIYVVGNETARQGPDEMDYAKTAPAAIKQGIIVNAIYCGDYDKDSATPTWREVAKLADGQYMEISQDGGAVIVATPFDAELAELSTKLNGTYLAFGKTGAEKAVLQMQADTATAAQGGPASSADRAFSKSSTQYRNYSWDLVDASKEKDFKLGDLKDEDLPEAMRKMTPEQREAHIAEKAKEREAISAQIKALSAKRDAHIKEEVAKSGLTADKAFDEAVKKSLREQGEKAGYAW